MRFLVMFLFLSTAATGKVYGQVFSNKEVGSKSAKLIDSLKQSEYPYILPIWGAKATALGFDLPYSAGLGVNYIWQESELIIENLEIGFNSGPKYNIDEIVRFDKATSEVSGFNFRPDIWILPFLNVYAVFAKGKPSTAVDFGIWVPDSSGIWNEVFNTSTKANFESTSVGFGLTPTIGVGGGWMALDMNFTWTDIPALEDPAFAFIFGPRFGKSFKLKKPGQTLNFWVGGFRFKINTDTKGSLPFDELFDLDGLEQRIDSGLDKVSDAYQQVDAWWNDLTPPQQANPVNKAKYETATRAIETAGGFLNAADETVKDLENGTVDYSLDKRPKDLWNFVVGSQFQINKNLMIRAEYGFLTSRTQFIGMLQYRFGL